MSQHQHNHTTMEASIHLVDLHDSIFNNITSKLNWKTLLNLKSSCAIINSRITRKQVIDAMIEQEGEDYVLMKFMIEHKINDMFNLIQFKENFNVCLVIDAICISIFQSWNEIAKELIDVCVMPKYYNSIDNNTFEDYSYYISCDNLCDIMYFLKKPRENTYISQTKLLQIACAADNVVIVEYLMQKYNLNISSCHVWQILYSSSREVFNHLLYLKPDFKVSQRILTRYMYTFIDNCKEDFLEFIFATGACYFSRSSLDGLIYHTCETINSYDIESNVRLIETYASQKQLQYFLSLCIDNRYVSPLLILLKISERVICKDKHRRMLNDDIDYWNEVFPDDYKVIKRAVAKRIKNGKKILK